MTLPQPKALMEEGIAAYREQNYARALESLQAALDLQPDLWNAKLYVAMCHYKSGMVHLAATHFRYIRDNCTDMEIRKKAEAALVPVNREAQVVTSTNIKKRAEAVEEDGSLLEWSADQKT